MTVDDRRQSRIAREQGMRILHVIAGAEIGGAETFAVDAITALADRGIRIGVLSNGDPDMLDVTLRSAGRGLIHSWPPRIGDREIL